MTKCHDLAVWQNPAQVDFWKSLKSIEMIKIIEFNNIVGPDYIDDKRIH